MILLLQKMVPVVFPDGIVAYVAHQGILNAQTSENGIVFGVTTRGRHKWEFMPAGFGGWIKSNLALGINNDIIITDFSNTPTASVSFLDFITGQLLSYVHPYPHGYQYDAEGVALDVDNEHLYLGGGKPSTLIFLYRYEQPSPFSGSILDCLNECRWSQLCYLMEMSCFPRLTGSCIVCLQQAHLTGRTKFPGISTPVVRRRPVATSILELLTAHCTL